MKTVAAGVLEIAYLDVGPADGRPVILLHGFPYDVHAYDAVAADLAGSGFRCLVPYLRGFGPTRFLSDETMRSGQQGALAADLIAFMDALSIGRAFVGGYDWGGRAACILAALAPERVDGLVSCARGYNIQDIANAWRPEPPEAETRYWYIYYFNTERGRVGLTENRRALCRLLWRLWSPSWPEAEEVFERSAPAFDNPDFVDIVIHSYRHRLGGIPGDPAYGAIEARLAEQPPISVPTIALFGADDGVDPPSDEDEDRPKFTGYYERRFIPGTGHNVPQEAPQAFAAAIRDLAGG